MVKISISVVCYYSPTEQLIELMNSIIASVRFVRARLEIEHIPIYLIDNSKQTTLSLTDFSELSNDFDELLVHPELISGHGNVGYGSAHNLVLDHIESDYHLMLNPDVTLEEDALYQAIGLLLANTKRKLLGPSAFGGDGEKQYLCKRYPSILTLVLRGILPIKLRGLFAQRLNHYEMRDLSEDTVTDDIPLLSGCFMLVDTATFKDIKGFDGQYFLYFEDFDLSLRINELGPLVYAPMVRIKHSGGKTSTKGLWHIMMFVSSAVRFFSNHGWRII